MADESTAAGDAGAQHLVAETVPDEVLIRAVDAARRALHEITPAATVGATAGHIVEGERVLSLLFETRLPGYPGWYWTVSLSREPDSTEVNVLEVELMPGEAALLAPDSEQWLDAPPEPLLHYVDGEARIALFSPAGWRARYAAADTDDGDRLERRFEQFQARQRQFAAVLGAHGIPVTFAHCTANAVDDL